MGWFMIGGLPHYPLVNKHSYWKWPFIVDLPIKHILHSKLLVYQRVSPNHAKSIDQSCNPSRRRQCGDRKKLTTSSGFCPQPEDLGENMQGTQGIYLGSWFSAEHLWLLVGIARGKSCGKPNAINMNKPSQKSPYVSIPKITIWSYGWYKHV